MILIFLGSMQATLAVFFSIPLSVLATFLVLHLAGSSINSMVLGGLALALSRLIDNSVVVLENIFRHLEGGEAPEVAAQKGGREVALPVLAGTLTTVVVFFPVTLLYGVSRFLFSALALAVVISLFASYFFALTVVPLFCARFIKSPHGNTTHSSAEAASPLASTRSGFWERFSKLEGIAKQLHNKALTGNIPALRMYITLYPQVLEMVALQSKDLERKHASQFTDEELEKIIVDALKKEEKERKK
jgi:multidrug efflux pump subunit AcrB